MDIQVYEDIYESLSAYLERDNEFDNTLVHYQGTDTSFPFTVFEEVRNVANSRYNTCFNRISSVGYKVEVYAKTIGDYDKQTIARQIAKQVDEFLTNYVGLTRVGFVPDNLVNDASEYRITMTYNGTLFENRRKFI